jgi:hypothetical protein
MSFPYADGVFRTADCSELQLEFHLKETIEYNGIVFHKNEIIKMFEKLKFTSNKLIGYWDQSLLNYDLSTVWASVDSILFYDHRIVLKLKILDTPVGKTNKEMWDTLINAKHEFFVSLTHSNGKNLSFLTINYTPKFNSAVPANA